MPPRTRQKTNSAKVQASTTRRAKSSSTGEPERPVITIEDLQDFNESINLLVYGDSGVGKTPLVGTAPDAVFLSTEKGTISAKRFGSKAKLMRATTWERVEAAIDVLEADPDKFDWVIVDSTTKMQQLLLRHLLKTNVEEGRKMADLDVPQIQDHQKWQNMFKRFVDRLIDLDVNVIFVATAMHKEDAEGDDLVLPDVQGKDYAIAQYVCAQMDGVYYLATQTNKKTEEPEWFLLTKSRPPFFAKDRFNALPAVVRRPNMAEIIEAILNSGEVEKPNANVEKRRAIRKGPKPQKMGAGLSEDEDGFEGDDDDDLDEEELEEELDDDEEELDEEPPKKPTKSPAKAKQATKRAAAKKPEPHRDDEGDIDDYGDDEEDEEEEAKPASRRMPRKSATRTPARKTASKAAKKASAPDDFDPDDDEDDDDWDEED